MNEGRPRGGWLGKTALALAGLAVLLAGAVGVYRFLHPEPVTFRFGDRILTAVEGVPTNQYDQAGFTMEENGRVSYAQNGKAARTGVDVSFYQREIDWSAVAADGIDFAILRLGYRGYAEGNLKEDSRFSENLRGALAAGLDVGVYFFSQAITPEEAEEEADFVLSVLDGQALAYPIAFDWEPITGGREARTDGLDGQTLTQCAVAFCEKIQAAGYEPAVYFNQSQGYFSYDLGALTGYTLWLAEYDGSPDFYYRFDLWQYTHTGTVAGIQGNVDMNLDLRTES